MSERPLGPALTVDCVVFDAAGRLLLIKRGHAPFEGRYALPGGFVDMGEKVEAAALRELKEETGLKGRVLRMVGVYSDPKRDPRGHAVSVAFLIEAKGEPRGGDDAASAEFVDGWKKHKLAFDHDKIVKDAVAMILAKR